MRHTLLEAPDSPNPMSHFLVQTPENSREKMPMSGILTTHAIERKYAVALRFVSIQPERDQRSSVSMATLR